MAMEMFPCKNAEDVKMWKLVTLQHVERKSKQLYFLFNRATVHVSYSAASQIHYDSSLLNGNMVKQTYRNRVKPQICANTRLMHRIHAYSYSSRLGFYRYKRVR